MNSKSIPSDPRPSRRRVLKLVGIGALAGTGLGAGTAAAADCPPGNTRKAAALDRTAERLEAQADRLRARADEIDNGGGGGPGNPST